MKGTTWKRFTSGGWVLATAVMFMAVPSAHAQDTIADSVLASQSTAQDFSSNLKATANDTVRLQFVFGEGIQNYMNDAPADVGIVNNFQNAVTPILGEPLPIVGIVAFLDHTWNQRFSSTVGYSLTDIDNADAQTPGTSSIPRCRM